jgi:hypothetical protein
VVYGSLNVALGETEWATTQTVHVPASIVLGWWCAANVHAEQNVTARHSNAAHFENDRMTATP